MPPEVPRPGTLTAAAALAGHPDGLAALPEHGAVRIGNPGQGEVELFTAGVDLQLQVVLRAALSARVPHLKHQGAIEGVVWPGSHGRCLGQAHGMTPGLAAEIGSGSHQLAEIGLGGQIRDRHGWRAG